MQQAIARIQRRIEEEQQVAATGRRYSDEDDDDSGGAGGGGGVGDAGAADDEDDDGEGDGDGDNDDEGGDGDDEGGDGGAAAKEDAVDDEGGEEGHAVGRTKKNAYDVLDDFIDDSEVRGRSNSRQWCSPSKAGVMDRCLRMPPIFVPCACANRSAVVSGRACLPAPALHLCDPVWRRSASSAGTAL